MHLIGSSKKGVSAHQIHRSLGVTYKTAWFMMHRIREAMTDDSHKTTGGLGGANEPVEVDETYVGGKAKNRAHRETEPKKAVLSLVERSGRVKSFHVANVTAETVRPIIVTNANRASTLMSDESGVYTKLGQGVRRSPHRQPFGERVRAPRRLHPHQHRRELLFDPQARHHGHLSSA